MAWNALVVLITFVGSLCCAMSIARRPQRSMRSGRGVSLLGYGWVPRVTVAVVVVPFRQYSSWTVSPGLLVKVSSCS